MNFKFLKTIILLNINFISYGFQSNIPKYKTIGVWNLQGTSSLKYQNSKINLQIIPKNNCNNLKIQWTKQDNIGPIIYKDILEGVIYCNKKKNINLKNIYVYKFIPNKYYVSVITIFGIYIENIVIKNMLIEKRYNIDNIKCNLQNEILVIEINNEHYIFQRNMSSNIQMIRLDYFIVSQILGYIIVKLIDHLHIIL